MATKIKQTLGQRIADRRQKLGMTQQALAQQVGVSLSSISQLEQGVSDDPRLSTLRKLTAALGVSLEFFAE